MLVIEDQLSLLSKVEFAWQSVNEIGLIATVLRSHIFVLPLTELNDCKMLHLASYMLNELLCPKSSLQRYCWKAMVHKKLKDILLVIDWPKLWSKQKGNSAETEWTEMLLQIWNKPWISIILKRSPDRQHSRNISLWKTTTNCHNSSIKSQSKWFCFICHIPMAHAIFQFSLRFEIVKVLINVIFEEGIKQTFTFLWGMGSRLCVRLADRYSALWEQ